ALALAASGAGETLAARAGAVRDDLVGTAERIAEALSERGGALAERMDGICFMVTGIKAARRSWLKL
uniref:hypothetical protein n=1 Tax=Methylobacterium sp. B34 TaxID=95563 RepID=UPI0005B26629